MHFYIKNELVFVNSKMNYNKLPHAENAHSDSLTSIINDVVEKRALTVGDIRELKKGETIEVILFDRNIGDYFSYARPGVYPTKFYIDSHHKAIYTHHEGLSGTLRIVELNGYVENCDGAKGNYWTWEVNAKPRNKKLYWAKFGDYYCDVCNEQHGLDLKESDLDDNIKVGWRGPAILYEDLSCMPEQFHHYDTAVDDYFVVRTHDLSSFKTTNRLSERRELRITSTKEV